MILLSLITRSPFLLRSPRLPETLKGLGYEEVETVKDLDYDNVPSEKSDSGLASLRLAQETLRSVKKGKTDQDNTFVMAVGTLFYGDVSNSMSKTETNFISENFKLLYEAHSEMLSTKKVYSKERYFQELCDNISAERPDWLLFFSVANRQTPWAERCTGCLGNLATLLRLRGDYQKAYHVMLVYIDFS